MLVCIETAAKYPNTECRKQVSAQTPAKSLAGMIAAQVRCRADVHAVHLPDAVWRSACRLTVERCSAANAQHNVLHAPRQVACNARHDRCHATWTVYAA